MNTKDEQFGEKTKLEKQIECVKYTLFCFNIVAWMFGASLFGITVWIRSEPGFEEWVNTLLIRDYYIGIYILILGSILMMAIAFLGCVSALMENTFALLVFVGIQIFGFIIVTAGTGVLMDYSTMNSSVQPIIRDTMNRLIMRSEYPAASVPLKLIQENIGCCGADGPNDYIIMRQPLPIECRDTVTGNAFFHGCVEELTWVLEDKSGWVAGVAMSLALINVVSAAMSLILIEGLKKEEEEARIYRR